MVSNIPNVPDYINEQDYEYILNRYLGNVRNDVDKREGSIIWDAGSPLCIELAIAYMYVQNMMLNCFVASAGSPYLELRCEEQGINRNPATYAKRLATFTDGQGQPYAVPIGTTFSTVAEQNLVNYTVTEVYTHQGVTVPGSYIMTCEQAGEIGNEYFGEIVPVFNLTDLATATLTSVLVPGEDIQDLEDLRQEYFEKINEKAFGGNITEYKQLVESIEGVGSCQVYPVWDGGGTVKISFLDSQYNRPSDILLETVQNFIDPYYNNGEYKGKGLGRAPVGHVVTVTRPEELQININTTIEVENGFSIQQVEQDVKDNLTDYLLQLRKRWDKSTDLNEYYLKVVYEKVKSIIISTPHVENILRCDINGEQADIELAQNTITQTIPVVGEIIIG